MVRVRNQIEQISAVLPDDRLTWQKAVATLHPETVEETKAVFKAANRLNQRLYITGFGNNISPEGDSFSELLAVKTDRLNNIIEVNRDDFYITVGAGYPLREINKALKKYDLWLPHSALPYVGSCAGAVAVGLSANYEGHDFPLKKYFIKAEIITPEGDIIKPGSNCFKSVSGYDIVRIYSGSWGLLGFLQSLTFRVMPISGESDYSTISQKNISRKAIEDVFLSNNDSTDAVYCRKIKDKFDPNKILPLITKK